MEGNPDNIIVGKIIRSHYTMKINSNSIFQDLILSHLFRLLGPLLEQGTSTDLKKVIVGIWFLKQASGWSVNAAAARMNICFRANDSLYAFSFDGSFGQLSNF